MALASGTLNIGTGGATFDFPQNLFQWTGGTISTGTNTLTNQASSGFITLNGTGNLVLSGTLDNAGTITQTTPGTSNNTLFFDSGSILNNTGLFDIQQNGTGADQQRRQRLGLQQFRHLPEVGWHRHQHAGQPAVQQRPHRHRQRHRRYVGAQRRRGTSSGGRL